MAGPTPVPGAYSFSVTAGLPTTVYSVMHNATNWNTPCSISVTGGTPAVSATCLLEVEEGDIHYNDFTLNWTAGVGGCPYVIVYPYWVMKWPGGYGAQQFSYTSNNGVIDAGSIVQTLPSTGGTLVHVVNNEIKCIYDHRHKSSDAPNACAGTYSVTHTAISTSGTLVTTTPGNWSGKIGDGAAGPGTHDDWYRDPVQNIPGSFVYTSYAGNSDKVSISKLLPLNSTNVGTENYQTDPNISVGMLSPYGNPYYRFLCVDGSNEVLGDLKVMIRGWNLASELAKGSLGVANTSGTTALGDAIDDFLSIDNVKGDPTTYPNGHLESAF